MKYKAELMSDGCGGGLGTCFEVKSFVAKTNSEAVRKTRALVRRLNRMNRRCRTHDSTRLRKLLNQSNGKVILSN